MEAAKRARSDLLCGTIKEITGNATKNDWNSAINDTNRNLIIKPVKIKAERVR